MALRNILSMGDPALKRMSRPVTDFDERLHILLDDMKDTLSNASGVGLAAPQVGVLRRVILVLETNVEEGEDEGERYVELVNPVITLNEGAQTGPEGCLSLPGRVGIVERPMSIAVQAQDRNGDFFEFECRGITARAICHEADHLDGVLYTEVAERMLTQEEIEEMFSFIDGDEDEFAFEIIDTDNENEPAESGETG